ncbi:MAG: P1 family peptidase, partial [Acidimicrobiia bacterium]|nr:P1 family peptidase [Acidimicrobiia bacterium]
MTSLTDVPGVGVGHWQDDVALTGVTVLTFPEPNVAAVEVRGAAPGTRETALLAPGMKVEQIQALMFAGGSAFGLGAADGVVAALAAEGRGHPTVGGPIPIVPAAILYDLMLGDAAVRPSADSGAAAFRNVTQEENRRGTVGAGAGALVAGWRGPSAFRKGGLGMASMPVGGGVVAALAVVNAVGDVFSIEGEPLTEGPLRPGPPAEWPKPLEATTLVCVVTDVGLSRTDLMRACVRGHDAIGTCIRPSHTRYD